MTSAPRSANGFTYIEVLIAIAILAAAMLSLCAVSTVGYRQLTSAGRTTIGLSAARQMAEDLRGLPFSSIASLNGFNTDNAQTQPASDPAREIARRWRFALAGDGVGWSFTTAEKTRWTTMSLGEGVVGGSGSITVVARSSTLSEVQMTVGIPGRFRPVQLTTLVASMAP